ncbi:prepilin-type N-terminal cleavage/methylation domain-containing protein [Thermosulfurimonas marina]|uniref:Prepilin-type N-terminal cleavage/methylation domain-containing protein n=1 Tax=Thermosulfurimonas marina TaxID=2047767 RepID=A0A6H1WTI2_9BACT|nr:prepilin-type N-terminal cleavage/methylation domain-containing protein [Thermosulfurimonas marina]QJA06513.1 prepilin-type N-terminal cleavage/methylation domain-containing protein [Thermosulfurimonas marina]
MVRKVRERQEREKGFTLVELMIVIAIIAILAAVALSQYSSYKNKAKAKDLVGIARSCVMEIVTECQADPSFNNATSLESCQDATYANGTKYLQSGTIKFTNSFSSCSSNFDVTVEGQIVGGPTYEVTCTYDVNTNDVSCGAPRKQ